MPAGIGLILVGGGFAGVFPALMLLTPGRFGQDAAAGAVGYFAGASEVGKMILLPLAGLAFQRWSLGRHQTLRRLAEHQAVVSLPGAILGCPAWFAADGAWMIAQAGRRPGNRAPPP